MLMLLMYGAGDVWAQSIDASSIIINVMPSGTEATSSATATEGSVSATVSERVVTLTVTPESGYYIKASDIVVEPLASMGRANAPRRGGVMDLSNEIEGTLYNHETGRTEANVINSVSYQNTAYYVFELPTRYDGAYVTATFTASTGEIRIPNGSSITYNASGHYILENDIAATALEALFTGSQSTAFSGTFEGEAKADGTFPKITGATHALFDKISGGTVKNVMLDNVTISSGTNVGAICNEATGASRIYNCGVLATTSTVGKDNDGYDKITSCSSTISGSGYVGGIVGLLDGSSRVINCFSYANVSGGTHVGGIVGYNNVATTSSNLQTMVMNCMFYGEVSGSSIAPIYNGKIITNDGNANGVNNFNYFRIEASYIQDNSIVKVYNCALGAETRFLQRFEFYRNLLNSNRELAAWWATDYTTNKDDIAKWVLDKAIAPYPILKKQGKYPSIINYDPEYTYDSVSRKMVSRPSYSEENRNKGAKIGTLDVRINNVGSNAPSGARIVTSTLRLVRTDKDYDDYNFNFDKIQLPYYNEVGIGNYTDNKVVTGWKIVSITGGTEGSYSTGADVTYDGNGNLTATPYNFADRKCTKKDLFSVSGRVFNQGAYWDVPEGVTSITIEPYWGKAVYLADAYWDVTYKSAMANAVNVANVGGGEGQHYSGTSTFNGQTIYTSMNDAIASSGSGSALFQGEINAKNRTVYDYAVVLVGNYHYNAAPEASDSKPYTVTSIDLDGDNEPDYSLILRFDSRKGFHPVRYDFLNLIGLGMAQKTTGGTGSYNLGIMQPKFWFEVTNTALFRVTQFEYSPKDRVKKPIILQGGVIEQWVTQQDNAGDRVEYFHVGGNVWFKEFHRGSHQDNAGKSTPHPPVSVTGGDFDKFYLTGLYQSQANIYDDNAECYISGGRFGEVAGAGMEGIGTSDGNGNITWIIDHADIKEFYGGGINYDKPVFGNIHTIIKNSHVTQFCGGPKFGDMKDGRTVKTVADNCTFGTYFGAGYGGNSYNRYAPRNHNDILNFPHTDTQGAGTHDSWNEWLQAYYKQDYSSTYKGVSTQFDYQFLPMSGNLTNVARIFVEYVAFSLATTHNVTSDLTGCIITGNYYGGGSLGKVDGDVTSTLTNCSVEGNVFGAGFSGSIPTVEVMNTEFITEPYYYTDLGTYRTAVLPSSTTEPKTTTTYHWQQATATEFSSKQIDKDNQILYTTEDLTTLGTVTGKVTLNIEGNTLVKGNVTENNVTTQSGGVFGGGDASAALGDTEVNIEASGQQTEGYNTYNVFGGGNKADVSGSVVVNMKSGVVNNDVYGGGALANTNIGNVTAGYGTDSETIPNTTTKTTTVNLQGGTINGDAYGGGLGRKAATGVTAVEATVYGDITVNLGAADASVAATKFNISNYNQEGYTSVVKSGRIFGANNLNGSPKGNVTVNIYKTVTGANNQSRTAVAAYKKKEGETGYEAPTYEVAAVYGGGNLADYTTGGKKAFVNINTCDISVESVYGGGNAAAVPATEVTVTGAYEIQYVFGGGNGKDPYTLDGGAHWTDNSGANVTGNAITVLTGGFIHEAYGASNEKGTIGGTATLQADDAGNTDDCALDIWKMVGAGKNADFFGDVNLVLGCMPEAKVDAIYGGADNANVFGNVTLTVTSGNFGAVYGGNNLSGIITGQIILNIEETGCRPINIDALYLGGNQAAYSKYGYYVKTTETEANPATGDGSPDEHAVLTNGKLTFLPRKSADDSHLAVKTVTGTTWTVYTGEGDDILPPYADPILNVRSFTHIGEVFGGGYGAGAIMYANPTVNINQTYGIAPDELGTIGNVYGGGDAAAVEGITTVNIGTEETIDFVTGPTNVSVKGVNITGNVYGGGKLADVRDITNVNICAKDNGSGYVAVPEGEAGVNIGGNVFGGGKGEAVEEDVATNPFYCAKAMVGKDGLNSGANNSSSTYANFGTHVRIGHGTVNGTVYGGGEMGRVEFHTEVTIGYGEGTGSNTKSPIINGNVFGAGMGAATHGYSGLVRGDSKVTIQGDAKVGQSVYGGGEKASVGKYEVIDGLPETPLWGGKCTVTIQGYAEIGPDNMQMVTASGKPDDTGHVFGAGAGVLPYENVTGTPFSIQPTGKVTYDEEHYVVGTDLLDYKDAYLKFIRSLGLASNTEVTIGGHAFVKGSVYGGSENGYVQANTHVTIAGGQVGNGDGVNRPYTDQEWAAESTDVLKECAHWPFESPYAPYDLYKDDNNDGKPDNATDGHTFYGNVFGGGRGYYPYSQNPDYNNNLKALGYSDGLWIREAGSVAGNTVVDITGGHILTSVYGGNEMTDVKGSCTVNMVGGTVGVPRTMEQIQAHPVTCNVFGAGKGDQRVNFHEQTNVASTQINISGSARIYGSTFGGGEDGHVLGNAVTNIGGSVTIGNTAHSYSDVLIGSVGTSGSDGNVFGGGRGFSETALTAGVVCGNAYVNIHNGKILGSVFGGGRLASVGTYLTAPILSGGTQNPDYGKMQEDSETESHGHTYITIEGGTIGDTDSNYDDKLKESDYTIGDVFGGGKGSSHSSTPGHLRYGEVKTTSITMSGGKVNGSVYGGGEIATVEGNTTVTINGGEVGDGKTKKGGAKIGNVYGGGKGSLIDPDDGLIKGNTKITINETDKANHPTIINHNIYGGGAYGSVGDIHRSNDGANYVPGRASSGSDMPKNMPTSWATGTDNGTAEINILGGQIGTDGDENGMVFGSSRGDVATPEGATSSDPLGTDVDPNDRTAWVYDTKVVIGASGTTGPDIRGSVYGSGENGHVFHDTDVTIHSGKIGVDGTATITDPVTNIEYTGADYPKRGNIYGGGCGEDDYEISDVKYYNPMAGIVLGNTKVTVDGGKVVHNIYGGGALGSVGSPNLDSGGKATIEISGGVIGDNGINDGNVYGASRGNLAVVQANIAQVKETQVDIKPNNDPTKEPIIWNDVFGGGEAGTVIGNVTVNISGGHVYNDVYGGGALANTNTGNWDDQSNLADNAKTKTYYAVSSIATGDDLTDKGYYKRPFNQATGNAQSGTTYYEKKGFYNPVDEDEITVGTTPVTGYYIEQFVSATEGTAVEGTTYFLKYYYPVDVATGADVTGYYTKTAQDTYVTASGTAAEGTTYYRQTYNPVSGISAGDDITGKGYFKVQYLAATGTAVADVTYYRYEEIYSPVKGISTGDDVTGYYTAGDYTSASGLAEANTLYYKVVTGDWATGKNENNKTTYKTVVNLEGGLIGHSLQGSYGSYTDFDYKGGDVYGGGLGRLGSDTETAVEAMVYGDIEVTVNGTAFIQRLLSPSSTENQVPLSGRVFGCNNLNGTPKGNVTVNVDKTIPVVNGAIGTNHDENRFEIHSVYGGGNMASYMPANGKKSKVNIYGCEETYIEKVFGGGNSASVPATDVEIFGTGYVGYAFGGGNGADKIWSNGVWNKNGGAPIYGDASIIAHGGKIGQVFSGSDTKGTVYGSATVKLAGKDEGVATSTCPLKITNTYGAGRGADINGDVNLIVSGCSTENAIERVFGGSYDANIRGDVNLTITSGIFTQVFGGNDHGGSIGGNINVNIEESDNCDEPTIIQYLYGGGREAIYPGPRARNTSGSSVARGKITVNVKSATRIDNVYGGSYRAQVNGDTEVNINMIKGNMVNQAIEFPESYRGDVIPNIDGTVTYTEVVGVTPGTTPVTGYYTCDDETATNKTYTKVKDQDALAEENVTYYKMSMSGTIKDEIGTIGNVFGGSFESYVNGNATVNIGTETSVDILKRATASTVDPDTQESITEGTILATDGKSIYGADRKMREGITIATEPRDVLGAHITGNVYGGGDNAELLGNTYVNICKEKIAVLDANNQPTGEYTYGPMSNTTVTSGVEIQGTKWQYGVFGGGNRGIVDGDSYVYLGGGSVKQSIYGGGCEADLNGNTYVTMQGGYVFDGVYGGGLAGSVGTVTSRTTETGHGVNVKHGKNDCLVGKPDGFKENTGKCTVVVSGGQVGPIEVVLENGGMKNTGRYYKDPNDPDDVGPVDYGFVFGAGRGEVQNPTENPDADFHTYVYETDVTISGGLIMASVYGGGENGRVRHNTLVKIEGGQIGCGHGKVLGDEDPVPVTYTEAQWTTAINAVTSGDAQAIDAIAALMPECSYYDYGRNIGTDQEPNWVYEPYDPYADEFDFTDESLPASLKTLKGGSTAHPSDGKTYYGCVFGGGSGYYPYEIRNAQGNLTGYEWLRSAGLVEGNTEVRITGGHILTNVYGGNEYTDIAGSCTIKMSGGTIGVPRTLNQIKNHPVTCYLFGGGKGDPRIHFNTWSNVASANVEVSGGVIFGSVFGGGEDGHILGDANVTIKDGAKIGTWGTSYVDGNVFGGGRGFSGEAQTAGTVGGNVTLNIEGGTMLGSVYGGGRLASVGTMFEFPTLDNGDPNPAYGNFKEDAGNNKFGHVTVNISGGTIGNSAATGDGAKYSGNVFGGSMGRLDLLDGTRNPIWPKMAQVKETNVNIYGTAKVLRSVYGGGEFGTVRDNAYVTIGGYKTADVDANGHVAVTPSAGTTSDPTTVSRDVYGGGYGSEDKSYTVINVYEARENVTTPSQPSDYEPHAYAFSPMHFAGCVGQNTYVHIVGGRVKKSVYGGGELASVGIINCRVDTDNKYDDIENVPTNKVAIPYENKWIVYSNMVKHTTGTKEDGAVYDFGLSWPYEFQYVDGFDGKTHVHITGGRIGLTKTEDATNPFEDFDNGDVYGGGKGKAGDYNDYVFCANVGSTEVEIDYNSTLDPTTYEDDGECIVGAVYGGAENGHVMGDSKLILKGGLIGHSIYGGGSGKGQFKTWLKKIEGVSNVQSTSSGTPPNMSGDQYEATCYSITAGKVFGNTEIEMTGGYVVRNVYGGGNMGSVGKGNYSGGSDDYSASGYGELPPKDNQALWTSSTTGDFPWHFLNSGKCTVKITGGNVGYIKDATSLYPNTTGLPYGNVFGGCRGMAAPNIGESPRYLYCPESFLGYANETEVIIGKENSTEGPTIAASVYGGGMDGHVRRDASVTIYGGIIGETYNASKYNDNFWMNLGNVYGGGSGTGKYQYDFNYDGDYEDEVTYKNPSQNNRESTLKETDYSTSAGSVTRSTKVDIQGGTIHRNVYGGGSLSSVGAPKIPPITVDQDRKDDNPNGKQSLNEVIISGGQIGDATSYDNGDNHVYGGNVFGASRGQEGLSAAYSTSIWTGVTITGSSTIFGDVYGGGERGAVNCGVDVNMLGGNIKHSIYGGGALANTNTSNWSGYAEYSTVMGKELQSGDDISGLYTKTTVNEKDIFTLVTSGTYSSGTYYALTWAEGKEATGNNNNAYHTKLNILGGAIGGEAYGGGLGQLANSELNQPAVEAIVYGDVTLNLNGTDSNPQYTYSSRGATVHQIFGANNLNGTPKGHVKVHIFATQNTNKDYTYKKFIKSNYDFNDIADLRSIKNNNITGSYITAAETALSYNTTFDAISTSYDNATTDDAKAEALLKLKTIVLIAAANELGLTSAVTEYTSAQTDEAKATALANIETAIVECPDRFDIEAVYGGGNLAAYIYGNGGKISNTDANKEKIEAARTEVIIDGCNYTSIKQVYGGGNAAPSSGTFVEVNGSYEIDEVFGGGNGADNYYLKEGTKTVWYENPGANVGYYNYTYITKTEQTGTSKDNPHHVSDNPDALSATDRQANYAYGSGIATTEIRGGTIHNVYGGSNKKGNISTTALSVYEEADDDCPIVINETYGGGKDAPMDGEINLVLDCVKDMDMIFGGAKNADVYNNVTLNITNGHYEKVFGGNNTGGALYGTITVNVEEKGCVPIIIDELYGGGYLAPYSKYGYEKKNVGTEQNPVWEYKYYQVDENNQFILDANNQPIEGNEENGKLMPLEAKSTQYDTDYPVSNEPRINIISASEIGTIYGGGYKAKLVGSPYINVNMQNGRQQVYETETPGTYIDVDWKTATTDEKPDHVYTQGVETIGDKHYIPIDLGFIGTIYGGGYLADVVGDTHIDIGTGEWLNSDWKREMTAADNKTYYFDDAENKNQWYYVTTTGEGEQQTTTNNYVDDRPTPSRNSATITDYVFGAGDNADVTGNTFVTIANGQIGKNVYGGGNLGDVGTISKQDNGVGGTDYIWVQNTGATSITISGGTVGPNDMNPATVKDKGNVYGAGKGTATSFECENAMVESTNVSISNGTVYGHVYGGGEIGRVEHNTVVTIGESGVNTSLPDIKGNVYGGGAGVETHGYSALVRGNSSVTVQGGAKVGLSIYGGGEIASVGKYKVKKGPNNPDGAPDDVAIGMPYALVSSNFGNSFVNINDNAEIGGNVYGAGKGKVPGSYDYTKPEGNTTDYHTATYEINSHMPRRMMNYYNGHNTYFEYYESGSTAIWEYFDTEEEYLKFIETLALTTTTNVTIGGNSKIKGSVYGGSENAFVQFNTNVTIGDNAVIGTAVENQNVTTYTNGDVFGGGLGLATFAEAGRVSGNTNVTINGGSIYGSVYGGGALGDVGKITKNSETYDYTWKDINGNALGTDITKNTGNCKIEISGTSTLIRGDVFGASQGLGDDFWCEKGMVYSTYVGISNGTVNGNVYGGGKIARVEGNTEVKIGPDTGTGTPHILGDVFGAGKGLDTHGYSALVRGNPTVTIQSSATVGGDVYGGGEIASVGRHKVKLSNDIPGDLDQEYHAMYQNLPMGMPYTLANTNLGITTVTIKGQARIAGDVYGAGQGVEPVFNVNNKPQRMGMSGWETFDDEPAYLTFIRTLALTTDTRVTIGENDNNSANVKVNGSVYGGSENGFVQFDTDVKILPHSEIGNDVFGGGLGLTSYADAGLVSGNTSITISGGFIKHNVYGGGKMGSVGTVTETIEHRGIPDSFTGDYTDDGGLYDFALSWPVETKFKPGTGNTYVEFTGGRIGTSGDDNGDIFGGGMGSLGIDWEAEGISDLESSTNMEKIIKTIDDYRYKEQSIANVNNTHVVVNIPAAQVPANLDGIAYAKTIWDVDDKEAKPKFLIDATYYIPKKTVDVLDANQQVTGQEEVDDYENGGFTAFGPTPVITGSVYGGSENGHVIGNTLIEMKNGIIGHAIYGGGKGKGTYEGRLYNINSPGTLKSYVEDLYSLTAGKVYGNTHIIMEKGFVIRSVFGGGNLGSIGKGNYSGGYDDYSLIGYGERTESDIHNLWTTTSYDPVTKTWDNTKTVTMADQFMSSGNTLVEIRGGQIGYILKSDAGTKTEIEKVSRKDDLPTGNVFGACRGQASPNGYVSPRYLYIPDFFLGYVNETDVRIGTDDSQPIILGSVYGGGQDGHVRRSTNVTINQAEIGIKLVDKNGDNPYSYIFSNDQGNIDLTNLQWRGRGNVFGAGSGIGSYDLKTNDGKYIKKGTEDTDSPVAIADNDTETKHAKDYNYSSGSVTCETKVEINELATDKTIIYQNVYGGGSLASIGPPNTGQGFAEFKTQAAYPRTVSAHKSTSSTNIYINGGIIGDSISHAAGYGGNVFGASRGNLDNLNLHNMDSRYATSIWTNVEARNGHILGNVFGGGESGSVTMDTYVEIGGKVPDSHSGAPRRGAPAVQPDAAAPASNVNSGTGNTGTSTPANVATEAPVNRTVTTRQAQ
jgi:hypothetical protein